MIQCLIENESKQVIIDTGATITVFRKTRNLPVSKLRLKSATSHKAALYGPEWTDIKVGGQVYRFPVYEADISENLLGYDFLDTFEGVVNTKTRQLELENNVQVPYTVVHSVHKGDFSSGKVSYAVRANQRILLKPFVERQISTKLETDLEIDEVGLADALRDLTISGYTRLPKEEQRLATLSTPEEQSIHTNVTGSPTSNNGGQPQRKVEGGQPQNKERYRDPSLGETYYWDPSLSRDERESETIHYRDPSLSDCYGDPSPSRKQNEREATHGSARDPTNNAQINNQKESKSESTESIQSPERSESRMHLGLLTNSINNTNTKSQLPPNILTSTGIPWRSKRSLQWSKDRSLTIYSFPSGIFSIHPIPSAFLHGL